MASIRFYSTGPLEDGIMRGNLIGSSHSKGVPEGSLHGERNVSLNTFWAHEGGHNTYVASPRPSSVKATDLVLLREGDIFRGEAFAEIPYEVDNARWRLADPTHLDFRLQSDSPARGAGPGGVDLGAFPYDGSVVYVTPGGDDAAAGTSERDAWRTLAHAVSAMAPGQTLYIAPGTWEEPLRLRGLVSMPDRPTSVRVLGRAVAEVPYVVVEDAEYLVIKGLTVRGADAHISVTGSRKVKLTNCAVVRTRPDLDTAPGISVVNSSSVSLYHVGVSGPGPGIRIEDSHDMELVSSVLAARDAAQIILRGDTADFWSEFNAFEFQGDSSAVLGLTPSGEARDLATWQALSGTDRESRNVSAADFHDLSDGDFNIVAGRAVSAAGRYEKPAGPGRVLVPAREREPFERVEVISTTRTSANLSWWTPGRITGTMVEWGTSPAYGRVYDRSGYERGEYETFHTASLLGLDPETTYHFRVGFRDHGAAEEDEDVPFVWSGDFTFRTAAGEPEPRRLYVAIDGDDARDGLSPASAWRSISHAAREARAGDTVTIALGRYLELLRPLQTGTGADRRITFRAEHPLTVYLDGGFVGHATGRSHCAQIMGKAYITLENLVFDRAARDDNGGYRGFPGHAGLVRISGSSGIEIRSSVMDGRRRYMVGLIAEDLGSIPGVSEGTDPLTVSDSLFFRNWYAFLVDGKGPVVLRNNAFIRSMVMMARFQAETVLRNNIFQSLIPNKAGNRLFSNPGLMDSDFNCFAWDAANARRIVAWLDRAERTYASGLTGFHAHFGQDANSESSTGEVECKAVALPRVLLVEDDAALCLLLNRAFTDKGYAVDIAHTCAEAARLFAEAGHDIIILDYILPDGQGDRLLDRFLANRPQSLCVMITGAQKPRLATEWTRRGAAAFVSKPFDPAYLIGLCERAMRERTLLRMPALLAARAAEMETLETQSRNQIQEARRHHAFQAQILRSVSEAVVVTDLDGMILYWGRGAEALYGYRADEVLNRPYHSVAGSIDPVDDEVFPRMLLETDGWRGEHLQKRRDGSTFWSDVHISILKNDAGQPIGFIGIDHDLTEQKRTAAMLEQAERMESIGRLAGGVAHDFNNILSVILGNTELAMDDLDPTSPLYAALREIDDAAKHSAELTRQLLAFARRQTAEPRELDLNAAVDDTLAMLRRLLGEAIRVEWSPCAEEPHVHMDPAQVRQVLTNLCINARDALGGRGSICIDLSCATLDAATWPDQGTPGTPGDYAAMAIRNHGSGMDKETVEHLFEPFFTTKTVGKGTGLGLATVYGIVQQNRGCIGVQSAPGEGTCITVYLPRLRATMPRPRPGA